MAFITLEKQLESVQQAIAEIEGRDSAGNPDGKGAQTYVIAGRSIERAQLATLYKREKTLKNAIYKQKMGISYNYFNVNG